ncbi:hypothetical protein ANCCAN_29303 [Ancylostoma caninum]|uniref:Uncharacterized protein n=1 Tax=Ancylostoma caninum TaxID=29170 RepID=A0A368F013_ANCCA|nr:hypothetical protein ANCCAN_29303 [Ancylostoma caninum]
MMGSREKEVEHFVLLKRKCQAVNSQGQQQTEQILKGRRAHAVHLSDLSPQRCCWMAPWMVSLPHITISRPREQKKLKPYGPEAILWSGGNHSKLTQHIRMDLFRKKVSNLLTS